MGKPIIFITDTPIVKINKIINTYSTSECKLYTNDPTVIMLFKTNRIYHNSIHNTLYNLIIKWKNKYNMKLNLSYNYKTNKYNISSLKYEYKELYSNIDKQFLLDISNVIKHFDINIIDDKNVCGVFLKK